jgi:hypothetical protein
MGYTLHVHMVGGERAKGGTPCMFILLAVEGDTPGTSILLVVERETPGKTILLAVEMDSFCISILLAVEGRHSHLHTAGGKWRHPAP